MELSIEGKTHRLGSAGRSAEKRVLGNVDWAAASRSQQRDTVARTAGETAAWKKCIVTVTPNETRELLLDDKSFIGVHRGWGKGDGRSHAVVAEGSDAPVQA
jgi:hypothetical protein